MSGFWRPTSTTAGLAASLAGTIVVTGCGAPQSQAMGRPGDRPAVVSGIAHQVHGGGFRGTEPAMPFRMPDVTLTATNNAPFNLRTDTAYPVTLVFFGYTHCPDVCPVVMNELATAYARLPATVRREVQVLFVTTDPARDSTAVLRAYLSRFNPSFVGLTGPLSTIRRAATALGVPLAGHRALPGGGYDVGHGAQVIGFHGNTAPVYWDQGTPVAAMVHDILRLSRHR